MRLARSVLGLSLSGLVAAAFAVSAAGGSATAATGTTESTVGDVRVGSFNIVNVSFDGRATASARPWRERRGKVAAQILGQRLDVVGVQEANQSKIYASRLTYGETQYADLLGELNARGGNYRLTNTSSYNCVNPRSTYKCVYQDRGAAGDNRILYDADTTTLVRQGGVTYRAHADGKPQRYLAWAVLEMKATGKRFLFTSTHLDPYSIPARTAQWDESIAATNELKGSMPVVAVGDYNTSKFSSYAPTYLPRMRAQGYGDVVNQEPGRNTLLEPRAETTYRAWVNSFNSWSRTVANYSYDDARYKIGNGIDWVFASNNVRVKAWAVVVDMDPRTLTLRGVIPSDHALVRATLVLP